MALEFQLLLFFLALFAGAVGWGLELAFAVARVAAIFAVEAFGRETPDAVAAEVAVGGNLEGLGVEVVAFGPDGNVAYGGRDRSRFHFRSGALTINLDQVILQLEYAAHDFDFVSLVLAFSHGLPNLLGTLDFSALRLDVAF